VPPTFRIYPRNNAKRASQIWLVGVELLNRTPHSTSCWGGTRGGAGYLAPKLVGTDAQSTADLAAFAAVPPAGKPRLELHDGLDVPAQGDLINPLIAHDWWRW
jgi:hypothetical protein